MRIKEADTSGRRGSPEEPGRLALVESAEMPTPLLPEQSEH